MQKRQDELLDWLSKLKDMLDKAPFDSRIATMWTIDKEGHVHLAAVEKGASARQEWVDQFEYGEEEDICLVCGKGSSSRVAGGTFGTISQGRCLFAHWECLARILSGFEKKTHKRQEPFCFICDRPVDTQRGELSFPRYEHLIRWRKVGTLLFHSDSYGQVYAHAKCLREVYDKGE